jgi:hypothetical protein
MVQGKIMGLCKLSNLRDWAELIYRQVVFVPKFTDDDEEKATLERVADHIDYIGKRCGRAHVGISSDFGKPLSPLIG